HQSDERAFVDVDLSGVPVDLGGTPGLLEPPTLGHGPELLERLPFERHLHLVPNEPVTALGGDEEAVASPAKTNLVLTRCEVALSDLVLGLDLELLRQLADEELPLDLGRHFFI